MCNKIDIENMIKQKESMLTNARRESDALNNGKYTNSNSAKTSKILVKSLEKEISILYKKLNHA